ncbi:MAG: hypothetical protein PHT69_12750 [Bacteroidales bacterium]|nr:hypothetical protein [Bacteroidales bacterium]
MKNTFADSIESGILSKHLFLDSPVTKGFIEWLLPYVSGEISLKTLSENYMFDSLKNAVEEYLWVKDIGYEATYQKFQGFKTKLVTATENATALQTCVEIVKWGSINNYDRLSAIGNVLHFLNHMKDKLIKDEVCIYDLNPNYINSGFTKIYAAYIDGFTMYDGRVGAAICSLVGHYLLEVKSEKIPPELIFGWAWGMGNVETRKNRNPNCKKFSFGEFPEITERARELHFISNIKANWLLNSLAQKTNIYENESLDKRVFALQSALFMLGEKIPE